MRLRRITARCSSVHGKGPFALLPIAAGERLIEYKGEVTSWRRAAARQGWAVVADTSPKEAIGLSGSIFNMFGNMAGIVTPIVIGYLVAQSGSFNDALAFVGVNALITIFSYLVIVRDIRRAELSPS
ncbi:hypothetical protein SAMN05192544_1030107 [Paraburkholderia hospita]|nr:hypothetical protein SAMN05192544_1030107 [Paraburkholderia hospita]